MTEAALFVPGSEPPPRMKLGLAGSVLLHGGVIALLVFVHTKGPAIQAPMIHMEMIAAPEGPAQTGVVDAPKPDQVVPKSKKAAALPKPVTPVPATKKTAIPMPAQTPPVPIPPQTAPAKAAQAAGGGTGGKGTDVTNIMTPGVTFADHQYLNNIVNAIGSRFPVKTGNLSATILFRIRRDGSVNADSMQIAKSSGNDIFNNQALSAVESAANQKAFGPLPAGFTGDGLLVTFIFDPKLYKQ